jgi:hypothetical protein
MMADNSEQIPQEQSGPDQDLEHLMAAAAAFHGIDVPVQAIRQEGRDVIITVQGGRELRCKLEELLSHHRDTEKEKEVKKKSHVKK